MNGHPTVISVPAGSGDFGALFGFVFAVAGWGKAIFAFEGTVEGGFGLIAGIEGDLRDAVAGGGQGPCSQPESPASQVGHRRDPKEVTKAFGEYRP